jgi:hypothetical protein
MNHNSKVEPAVELRRIPLAAIKIDPTIQQRVNGTSQGVVDDYAEALRDGVRLPPVIVFTDDGVTYWLADGFHRTAAHQQAYPDVQDIKCEVSLGGREDAVLFACGANASHGLRRSNEDKRKAVRALVRSEKWAHWSDHEIARQCRVSPPFVSKLRNEHQETFPDGGRGEEDQAAGPSPAAGTRPKNAPLTSPSRRRTAKRNGKSYPMSTAKIGATRATASRPKTSEATPLTSLAWSIATKPDRVKFVSAVGGREILEALKSIEPGFDILEWAWKTVGPAEREEFAKEHYEEIHRLAKPPGPPIAVEPLFNVDDGRSLGELKPDNDPLAIPTLLRRAKA